MPKPRVRANPLSGIVGGGEGQDTASTPRRPSFAPSPQQEAAAEWVRDGEGSAFIEAVAGSGKTSTLVYLCPLMSPSSVVFTAFNKKIADEIAQRTRSMRHVHAATFHSIGFQAWRSTAPHAQVDARLKGRDMVEEGGVPFPYRAAVKKLVSIGKQCLVDVPGQWSRDDQTTWRDLIDHYAITLDVDMDPKTGRDDEETIVERLIDFAADGVEWARDVGRGLIDFDDMLWLPLLEGVPIKTYDWVLVDEAQDTNLARRMFAERMAHRDSRLVFVGDRNQAIYGFSGASSNAVDQVIRRFHCTRLPLSVTYRCSKAATALAQTWVPHIEAHPDNAEGEVIHTPLHRFLVDIVPTLTPGDAVLCRNNKPLVALAFHLIRNGIACHVEGREIGKQLGKLAARWRVDTVRELGARLEEYRRREVEKLIARDAEHLIEGVTDRVETLFALMEGLDTVEELQERIGEMFQDTEGGQRRTVTLSTVHKCVHPDTWIDTESEGLVRIKNASESGLVACPRGAKFYTKTSENPHSTLLRIRMSDGRELSVTREHGIDAWDGEQYSRHRADELQVGQFVRVRLGGEEEERLDVLMPKPDSGDVRAKVYAPPARLSLDLAEFLGLMVADGTVFDRGFRMGKRHIDVRDRFSELCISLFGVKVHEFTSGNCHLSEVCSTVLVSWLKQIGGMEPHRKAVPDCILRSSTQHQARFLRGLFEDGTVNVKKGKLDHIAFSTKFEHIAEVVQLILDRIGVISSRRSYHGMHWIYIFGAQAKEFGSRVGFVSNLKQDALETADAPRERPVIPVSRELVENVDRSLWPRRTDLLNARNRGYVSRRVAAAIGYGDGLAYNHVRISHVEEIQSTSLCLEVPDGYRFYQNGVCGWNSKGREWDRVAILGYGHYMPSRRAKQDWEREQEQNLCYVAVTRTRGDLVLVGIAGKEEEL